jgi:hypothetical protein
LDLERYLPDVRASGLFWVLGAFSVLVVLNILTLLFGPETVLSDLNGNPLGGILSVVVFDTPGTIGGLLGLVLLFTPILFGTPVAQRSNISGFFVIASFSVGIFAGLLWDRFYDQTGVVGAGSSAVAIAGQGVILTLAFLGLIRLWRQDARSMGRMSSYWWHSFAVIYATLILTTVWFVALLQPIFIPTLQYNWRVHEFAFLLSIGGTLVYGGVYWSALGLDGKMRVDEMLLNFHFDDLNDRFASPLPKLRVAFAGLPSGSPGEFHPETGEIWIPDSLRGVEYRPRAREVDDALLHAMVHASLYYSGRPWQHGQPDVKAAFDAEAEGVAASPEP